MYIILLHLHEVLEQLKLIDGAINLSNGGLLGEFSQVIKMSSIYFGVLITQIYTVVKTH